MSDAFPIDVEGMEERLDELLDAVLSSRRTAAEPARRLAAMAAERQRFALHWVEVISRRNAELAYQFAARVDDAFVVLDREGVEAWIVHFMDQFDRAGMMPAVAAVRGLEAFVASHREKASGMALEEAAPVLERFVAGLAGRRLRLEAAEQPYTDSETLYLPEMLSRFPQPADNFQLFKAMAALHWAQTFFGTFHVPLSERLADFPDRDRALRLLCRLEGLRLSACMARELPGLHRQMQALLARTGGVAVPPGWEGCAAELARRGCGVEASLDLLGQVYAGPLPEPLCYEGRIRPDRVEAVRGARLEREKIALRKALARLVAEKRAPEAEGPGADRFSVRRVAADPARPDLATYELELDGVAVAPPDDVRSLMDSIVQDLGELPPELLVPAGDGGYTVDTGQRRGDDEAASVWQGTYHEKGAFLYNEWDYDRRNYRKSWCTLRELPVHPGQADFAAATLAKYGGLVRNLRRTFEVLRGEEKLLRRQPQGDEVDIDALVEALADANAGMELSERVFTRHQKLERDIAVLFMVDMSGSTKGWINDAERESLILLSEALETLGDRYAIYGFSSLTRKRCELYRVKRFDEPYGEAVQGRIAGITPQDYTRMGVTIRHLTRLLNEQPARTRLLVTLSDGKPDDYDGYRGRYGIEDTRQALFEARRDGVQAFCITIDTEARDYLPHMYGAANYTVVDDVRKLPLKVSDIYRKLTT